MRVKRALNFFTFRLLDGMAAPSAISHAGGYWSCVDIFCLALLSILAVGLVFLICFTFYWLLFCGTYNLVLVGNIESGYVRSGWSSLTITHDPVLVLEDHVLVTSVNREIAAKSDKCSICLQEEFNEGDECAVLPKCKHVYHTACIKLWFKKKKTCPLCRSLL